MCQEVRVKHSLSQGELAKFLGISRGSINRFENGHQSNHSEFVYHMLKQMYEANVLPNQDFIFPWKLEVR
jgi:DNA-binding XRE family transcriptional regulator